jgi:hypothetical protein
MHAKAFLQEECRNVKDVLDSTLQHEYGIDGSGAFFDECATRLEFITDDLVATDEADAQGLAACARRLNRLAELICRIERSTIGEYSWPFVEQLKKVALAVCTEDSVMGATQPPLIYVLADGGLDTYAIDPEQRKPGPTKRLILTIVFPKSLKHSVLLHSILGHEIGHAIYRCSKHQSDINTKVIDVLTDPRLNFHETSVADRLYASNAPIEAQRYTTRLQAHGIERSNIFQWASFVAWTEEILCDLVGLMTFGPSFVAAQCELLYALAPGGADFGDEHPPVGWRVNAIMRAAELLGLDSLPPTQDPQYGSLKKFWEDKKSFRRADGWFNVFTDDQLLNALTGIASVLAPHAPSSYTSPSFELLDHLLTQLALGIPPVGFEFDQKDRPQCSYVDFRHIIFAGWVASCTAPEGHFGRINRLCEHGIMQQTAIDLTLAKKPRRKRRA